MFDEKLRDVVDAYDIEVTSMSRTRGAFLCCTHDDIKLLKVYPYSENHLIYESMFKYVLMDRGYTRIDHYLYNKDGQLLTAGNDGKKYVMKQWFEGRECNIKNQEQVDMTVDNLAVLHKLMQNVRFECAWIVHAQGKSADEMMHKRLKEMKAIYNYIRCKKIVNAFEQLYMKYYDGYCQQAREAIRILDQINYREMYQEALENRNFCHGDYSYHHVLIDQKKIASINFERAVMDVQIRDLYYFLRKVLEKNDWDMEMGNHMIDVYHKQKAISEREMAYLHALLLFPEKFWKISNHYYNSRKSWTSAVNFEKLKKYIQQEQLRQKFLSQ